jgi:hypothetical protein
MAFRIIYSIVFLLGALSLHTALAEEKTLPVLAPPTAEDNEFIKPDASKAPAKPLSAPAITLPLLSDIPPSGHVTETPVTAKYTPFPVPPILAALGNTMIPNAQKNSLLLHSSPEVALPIPPLAATSLPTLPPLALPAEVKTAPVVVATPGTAANGKAALAETDTVKIILPSPLPPKNDTAPLVALKNDTAPAARNQPFTLYDREKDKKSLPATLPGAASGVNTTAKIFDLDNDEDAFLSIENEEALILEKEADSIFDFSRLPKESNEARLERLRQERIVARAIEVKKTQQRAHLNYKTQSLPEAIYNNHYSTENKHLPKPIYPSQYVAYTFEAIDRNDIATLRTFLDAGNVGGKANEKHDADGNTPLIYAAANGKPDIVRVLLARHSNSNAVNSHHSSALHMAAYTGQRAICEELIAAGALINSQDAKGYTPLILATMYNKPDIVSLLLSHHASKNLQDKAGRTALQIAYNSGNTSLIDLLKEPAKASNSDYRTIRSKETTIHKKNKAKPSKKHPKKASKKPAKKKLVKKKLVQKPAKKVTKKPAALTE